MKLYADEPGSDAVRGLDSIVVSAVARVEVVAALWRKHRVGHLRLEKAVSLTEEFGDDWRLTEAREPRFIVVPLASSVLERAALFAATEGLRAYDAVQLASALAARDAQPELSTFACFDGDLRAAAARAGMELLPA